MIFKRNIFFAFFIGLLISITTSFLNLNKYDQIDHQPHSMINGDIMGVWISAEKLKKDLYDGKSYFNSGNPYEKTYLSSRILAFYSYIAKNELFEDFKNNKIRKGGGKLGYLIFQSLFYYLALFFFYQKILEFYNYNYKKCFFITGFLALEPTIIQWHSSFWNESIFFSLQLITLGLIIHKTSIKFFPIIIGIFIGLMYLQKTVAVFFILPVIFYFIISKKEHLIVSIGSLFLGYLIILFFLGYENFKKTDIFYVTPNQSLNAHYHYLVPQVISKKNNVSEINVRKWLEQEEKSWIEKNKIDPNKFKDRRKLYKQRQKIALNVFLNNKIITTKIYIKKIIHHGLLNPIQVYYWHKYNHNTTEEYHVSSDHKKWIWKRILYSLVIYFFVFLGIIYSFKKNEYKDFNYFIILLIFYYMLILGFMGNTRYFMPSLILVSIFFGEGVFSILKNFSNHKTKIKQR